MQLKINYHHLDSTPSLETKIREKTERLKKYFNGNFNVEWTCEVEGKNHSSHIHLTGKNLNVNAQASDSDLYKTIDAALNKLEKQIVKQKDQVKDHIHHKH